MKKTKGIYAVSKAITWFLFVICKTDILREGHINLQGILASRISCM